MTASDAYYYRGSRKRELRRIADRVKYTLEKSNVRYVTLHYPTKYRERSIDLVALGDEINTVIRIKLKSSLNRDEAEDLIKASMALDAVPIMVSNDPCIYDNIVYEKEGIYILNERTLENMYLRPEEVIALYRRGELYVYLDKEKARSRRIERNLSLGDVSFMTGISRRTIYEYEKEGGMIAIETAEKIVSVLGDEAVKPINFEIIKKEFRRKTNSLVSRFVIARRRPQVIKEDDKKAEVYDLKKSAPDYLVKAFQVNVVVDASDPKKYSLKDTVKKVLESLGLSELLRSNLEIIVTPDNEGTLKNELSTYVSLNKVEIIKERN